VVLAQQDQTKRLRCWSLLQASNKLDLVSSESGKSLAGGSTNS
jgi:hypothetical protein